MAVYIRLDDILAADDGNGKVDILRIMEMPLKDITECGECVEHFESGAKLTCLKRMRGVQPCDFCSEGRKA